MWQIQYQGETLPPGGSVSPGIRQVSNLIPTLVVKWMGFFYPMLLERRKIYSNGHISSHVSSKKSCATKAFQS